jgi:hypothetical protein
MKKLGWMLALALAGLGCDGSKKPGGPGTTAANAREVCAGYLKCVADEEPENLAIALLAYGDSGSCWMGGSDAQLLCGTACQNAWAKIAPWSHKPSCMMPVLSQQVQICTACFQTQCQQPWNACMTDPSCAPSLSCLTSCLDGSCACAAPPASSAPAIALGACLQTVTSSAGSCHDDCSFAQPIIPHSAR